jgi:hypothetical protein
MLATETVSWVLQPQLTSAMLGEAGEEVQKRRAGVECSLKEVPEPPTPAKVLVAEWQVADASKLPPFRPFHLTPCVGCEPFGMSISKHSPGSPGVTRSIGR